MCVSFFIKACTHQEVLSVRYYSDAPPTPAPITCNKLQNFEADNDRYLIVLKECHTAQDAERLIKIVNKYQSSLTYLPNVGQLQGTLSNEALSQVHMHVCTYTYVCTYINTYFGH